MLTLYIVRGLPGSGKSTFAKELAKKIPRTEHVEADMYFVNEKGEYLWNRDRIGAAHEWCYRETESGLYNGYNVVVSNTFTTFREIEEYVALAERAGVKLVIIECTKNYGNVHNVPEKTLEKMKARWVPNSRLMLLPSRHPLHNTLEYEFITL